jgi:hypothetical protein
MPDPEFRYIQMSGIKISHSIDLTRIDYLEITLMRSAQEQLAPGVRSRCAVCSFCSSAE